MRIWKNKAGWLCLAACACAFSPGTHLHAEIAEKNDDLKSLLTAAARHERAGEFYDALADYQRAENLSPANSQAIRGVVLTTDHIGSPQVAWAKLEKHKDLFTAAEKRRIEGDEAAAMVRHGTLEPASEAERYDATDKALARIDELIARWTQEGPTTHADVLRLRFDRLVVLRNRTRMQDVVEEYQKLLGEQVEVPVYALSSVAEAYLYLRQPETARDLYLKVLEKQPHDFNVQAQLFFAYMECDDYDSAYALIDGAEADQPLWIPIRGSTIPLANPARQKADMFAADGRMDGGELADAARRMDGIVNPAPFDARDQNVDGNLNLLRGPSREAQTHYEIGKYIEQGKDVSNETGIALADLDLQKFPANEAETADLLQRFPEQQQVQRAARLRDVHNMAELQVTAGYGFPPESSRVGGRTYEVETVLYSPPIEDNWRTFADEMFAHGDEPNDEGSVGFLRNAAGIEYRNGDLTAALAPTVNFYHDTERPGIGGNANWEFNDQWSVFGGGEYFSRDTPIRALNAGVTANEVKLGGQWREDESRSDRVTFTAMPFSDGNTQFGLANAFTQRVYSSPHWAIDGLCDVSVSQSTADENRRYYNPERDLMSLLGAQATQILYHRYETVYQHTLRVTPGVYWEQNFGASNVIAVRYENRMRMNDVFEAGLGVDFIRRSFDGAAENDIGITFDLMQRF